MALNVDYQNFLEEEITRMQESKTYRKDEPLESIDLEAVFHRLDESLWIPSRVSYQLKMRWPRSKLKEREAHAEQFWNDMQYLLKRMSYCRPTSPRTDGDYEIRGVDRPLAERITDVNVLKRELGIWLSHPAASLAEVDIIVKAEYPHGEVKIIDGPAPKKPIYSKIRLTDFNHPWPAVGSINYVDVVQKLAPYLVNELKNRRVMIERVVQDNKITKPRYLKHVTNRGTFEYMEKRMTFPTTLTFSKRQPDERVFERIQNIAEKIGENYAIRLNHPQDAAYVANVLDNLEFSANFIQGGNILATPVTIGDEGELLNVTKNYHAVKFLPELSENTHDKDYPDKIILDFDKMPDVSGDDILRIHRRVKQLLETKGIKSRDKYSGGKGGLHTIIDAKLASVPPKSKYTPLDGEKLWGYDEKKQRFRFARDVALYILIATHAEIPGGIQYISVSPYKRRVQRLDVPLIDVSPNKWRGVATASMSPTPKGMISAPLREMPKSYEEVLFQAHPKTVLNNLDYQWPEYNDMSAITDFTEGVQTEIPEALQLFVNYSDPDFFFEQSVLKQLARRKRI